MENKRQQYDAKLYCQYDILHLKRQQKIIIDTIEYGANIIDKKKHFQVDFYFIDLECMSKLHLLQNMCLSLENLQPGVKNK